MGKSLKEQKEQLIDRWQYNFNDPEFSPEDIEYIVNEAMELQRRMCAQAVSTCERRDGTDRISIYEAMGACHNTERY